MSQVLDEGWQQQVASSIAHHAEMAKESIREIACLWARPSAIYRPSLSIDGSQWCALYGENLQDGAAGFGDSPAEAMADFDIQWETKIAKAQP